MSARFPVPIELENWLHTLLAVPIGQRYRRAADAAWGLARLGEPVGDVVGVANGVFIPDDSSTFTLQALDTRPVPADANIADRGPVPTSWGEPARSPPRPSRLGLGLLGMRAPSLVGRTGERAQLWRMLGEAATHHTSRAVRISGPGHRQLARWFSERAHELGAGTPVWLDGANGLQAAVRAWVRDVSHLPAMLGVAPRDARALALAAWLGGGDVPVGDQIALAAAVLGRCDRALILVVSNDPVHLQLARRVLAAQHPAVVVGLDAALGNAVHLELGQSSDVEIRQAIQGVLPLEPALAHALAHDAAGDLDRALSALTSWAAAGELTPGPNGFTRAGRVVVPPVDTTWLGAGAQAIGLGAVLGVRVIASEWLDLCAALGVDAAPDAVDRGVRRGLLVRHTDGWAFNHERVQRALVQDVEPQWHAAAATVVGSPARAARHLEEAGRPGDAAKAWLEAGLRADRMVDSRSLAAFEAAERCVVADGNADTEVHAQALSWWGWSLYTQHRFAEGGEVARRCLAMARRRGWLTHEAGALHTLAAIAGSSADADAPALFERASAAYAAANQSANANMCEFSAYQSSNPPHGEHIEAVKARLESTHVPLARAFCLVFMSTLLNRDGRAEEALAAARAAIDIARESDHPSAECEGWMRLASAAGSLERWSTAQEAVVNLRRLIVDDWSLRAVGAEIFGAWILVGTGDLDAARTRVAWATARARDRDWRNLLYEATATLATVHAVAGDTVGWDDTYDRLGPLGQGVWMDSRLRPEMVLARRAWSERGDPVRADQADALRHGPPSIARAGPP
jgi:tetratricopeptide (TPR) repeat protein